MSQRHSPKELDHRPRVSVVVPCYNYGHYLTGAVNSVLDQADVDADVLIIDDASPDGSGEVASEMAAADPRIRVIRHDTNKGHIATYNEGLEIVEGDYIVLLSADDMLTPGSLGRATALMECHPSVGLVYGFPVEFLDVAPPAATAVRSWTVWSGQEWIEARCQRAHNVVNCPEVVMRGSVQRAIGGYDPALPHSGDLEMWLRAAAVSDVGRVNGSAQAYYRIHPNSMQRTVYAGHLTDLEGRLLAFESVLLGSEPALPNGAHLDQQVRRALAASALDWVVWAYDEGRTADEPIDDYIEFAQRVYPNTDRLREWRTLTHIRRVGPERAAKGLPVAGRKVIRDLNHRIRWRRWRRSGV